MSRTLVEFIRTLKCVAVKVIVAIETGDRDLAVSDLRKFIDICDRNIASYKYEENRG